MRIGMVGLGRMGANMVRRLQQGGHECVAYDHTAANVRAAVAASGVRGAATQGGHLLHLVGRIAQCFLRPVSQRCQKMPHPLSLLVHKIS